MAQPIFTAEHFQREEAAFAFLEARVWPEGPVCPHCSSFGHIKKLAGRTTRVGLHKCYDCMKPFTVKVGTAFESSHVKLHLWLQAVHLMCSSRKGVSSNQLHRTLGVTLKTAWFMTHRIREAMASGNLPPMGGPGQVVEVDETFIGQKPDMPKQRGYAHKHAVLTLVERGRTSRSFHVDGTKASDLLPIIKANVDPKTHIMTDEAGQYASSRSILLGMTSCSTARANTCAATCIPTPSRGSTRFSSAA